MDQYVRSDFYVPLMMSARLISDPKTASLEARDARNLRLKGRLAPGVTQAKAQAELTTIGADLQQKYPDTNKNRGLVIRTELQARIGQSPPDAMLIAMLSTLAFAVLFVACANVAGLMTSRAPVRAREMALRLAIGAGRGQLVRQLITESLLISLAGGVLGLGIGYAGMTLFRQIELPTDLPIMLTFQMDRRALGFSFIVAVVSAVLFGLVPAIQATRTDLTAVMKASDSVAPGRRRRWGRTILVGGQVIGVGRRPRRRHVHVSSLRRAAVERPRLPDRSPADDGVRPEPGALLGGTVAAVLPAGRRAGACDPRRHERHDDHVHSDVERLDRLDDDCTGRLSVPSRQGQRHDSLVESRRILFRHDGHPAAPGPQLQHRRRRRRAARRHRQPATRQALLAESGSARQALSAERPGEDVGPDRRRGQRPRSTSSSPSRRRTSCICRTARTSRNA